MIPLDASRRDIRNILAKFGQGAFYATGGAMNLAHNVNEIIVFETEVVDVNSWFAANVFTPKQPGYYLLFAKANIPAGAGDFAAGDFAYIYIRKNTATCSSLGRTSTVLSTMSTMTLVEANGTDTFDVYGLYSGGAGDVCNITECAFGGVFVSYNNP